MLSEKIHQVEQSIKYEKVFKKYEPVKSNAIIDDDFWKVPEDTLENNEGTFGKGLWIMSLDSEIVNHTASLPVLPKIKLATTKSQKFQKISSKSKLEEQQEAYLKVLQSKQPIGRDGKRIPLPALPKNPKGLKGANSTLSMTKSTDAKLPKYSGFN